MASSTSCYSSAVKLLTARDTALGTVLFLPTFIVPPRGVQESSIRTLMRRQHRHMG